MAYESSASAHPGGLNNRNLCPHSSEDRKSGLKMLAGLVSLRPLSLATSHGSFSVCVHPWCLPRPDFLLLEGHRQIGSGLPPYDLV